jgi:putative mRNA 3-end processing factor
MLTLTEKGYHCAAGDFYVDPWRPVHRALVTHAHSDHARPGSGAYLCASDGVDVLRVRLGAEAAITGLPFGKRILIGDVQASFHPAGHVLGSAQIRLEHHGEIWVVSGDYKLQPDPTCTPFEPVRCHVFVTESTFGLPVYRWPNPTQVFTEIHEWWTANQEQGRLSLLYGYSLGKAQRLLAGLQPSGPILVHQAIAEFLPAYAKAGVHLPPTALATAGNIQEVGGRALVLAPPAAADSLPVPGDCSAAFASGWMLLRGTRRRQGADRGFALSDHADWPGLLEAIQATRAERVLVTHGHGSPLVRYLNEQGWQAETLVTPSYGGAPTAPPAK